MHHGFPVVLEKKAPVGGKKKKFRGGEIFFLEAKIIVRTTQNVIWVTREVFHIIRKNFGKWPKKDCYSQRL